ncbi:hypothetical protein [Hymenobacter mucosus]|uniref:Uncharacterized protein n=1 Tax=Hymenobacter mucosus TaxID=1411120 RepID=A0A238WAL0_9BACT|nr:hypothetical protein [Hymenobacter mucosus]SNR43243.1 hypothetical protein SAMN06269173_102374 [Hymenobacter mucosus]
MFQIIAIALFQVSTFAASPAQQSVLTSSTSQILGHGTSGWGEGQVVAAHGTSGWGEGQVVAAHGTSGWGEGQVVAAHGTSGWGEGQVVA